MKTLVASLAILTQLLLVVISADAQTIRPSSADSGSKLVREKGTTYIEDIFPGEPPKIELLVLEPAIAYGDPKAQRKFGVFDRNEVVDLVAVSEFAYKVRGEARHGRLAGWVSKKKLSAKDPKFTEKLDKIIARNKLVAELIENKQIAIGMTPGEVAKVLGDPTRREARVTAKGKEDVWEYITYETVNHYDYFRDPTTGQTLKRFAYAEKIESGKVRVEFSDGAVSAISESDEDPGRGAVKIVPVPLEW